MLWCSRFFKGNRNYVPVLVKDMRTSPPPHKKEPLLFYCPFCYAMLWNEWKIKFSIFIFRVMIDFVHNFHSFYFHWMKFSFIRFFIRSCQSIACNFRPQNENCSFWRGGLHVVNQENACVSITRENPMPPWYPEIPVSRKVIHLIVVATRVWTKGR